MSGQSRVILIHGVHTPEGDSNIGRLAPAIEAASGKPVTRHDYGFMGFLQTYFRNAEQARRLAAATRRGDWWVTHSNGASIAWLAVHKHGARPGGIINFNPALDRHRTFNPVPYILTIHSDGDTAVRLSQYLPFHTWGDQGLVGYKGGYSAHQNVNGTTEVAEEAAYKTHTGAFSDSRYKWWGHFVGGIILRHEIG